MKHRIGGYKCLSCDEVFTVSNYFTFANGFRPAAVVNDNGHPMYWRGDADE